MATIDHSFCSFERQPRKTCLQRHMFLSIRIPNTQHRLCASLFATAKSNKTTMASTSNSGGAFTTIQERVIVKKEIKKSKFIAIAGPISDEKSAMSFLSQVHFLHFFSLIVLFFFSFTLILSFVGLLLGP